MRPEITLSNSLRECTMDCSEEFKYKFPTTKKRTHIKESNKAIFIQRQIPCFLTYDIKFSGKVTRKTADCLQLMHRDCETITLNGQYGEELGVELMLEPMKVYCEHVDISGTLKVLCEMTAPRLCED